ncbi:MAG TPA: SDR family oxidoreductase [Caulobacteraceae bacterium]|nr:SDR family oxidoreductase [Caulobacteraceae bacterium]
MPAFAAYPSLAGRVVFVTGGASGIGAAIVEAFHGQGARVGFVDVDAAAGAALAGRLGAGAWFGVCNVTDAGALEGAVAAASAALGDVTVLVNNVADDTRMALAETSIEAWRAAMAVNLEPAFVAARACRSMMLRAGGGAIVNLSSINAFLGPVRQGPYTAAKGAINALTKSLAREWGPDGIRVNAVSPGWVVTERQLALWLTPEGEAEWMKLVALKRRIVPADVARAVLFLASDDAAMITGHNLVVDGGRT